MRMILLGFIALLAVNTSCAHRKNIVVDKSPLIELQCHGCRGYCPTFKVRILNNGDLIYEGIRSVEKMGVVTTGITPEELSDLRARVTAADLWHYPERIQSGIMDAPMATLTVFNGDKSHGITGTIDRPKPLLDLEQRIKELTEGHGMRVMKGVAPDITNGSAQQVIVHLKPGVNAGNWLAKFEELNLHLVRQLNADNTWLVSYNPAELKESSLIETLKNSNEVLDVQPNQQTKERN